MELDYEHVKEMLAYDPNSGTLTWKVNRGFKAKKGDVAGYVNKLGYRLISINDKPYFAHRIAWLLSTGEMPKLYIDHINGTPCDNRLCNLREVTHQQNMVNRKIGKNNTSGFKGVTFNKCQKKWQASARVNGKRIHLGYFNNPSEASSIYTEFTKKVHGEFTRE